MRLYCPLAFVISLLVTGDQVWSDHGIEQVGYAGPSYGLMDESYTSHDNALHANTSTESSLRDFRANIIVVLLHFDQTFCPFSLIGTQKWVPMLSVDSEALQASLVPSISVYSTGDLICILCNHYPCQP